MAAAMIWVFYDGIADEQFELAHAARNVRGGMKHLAEHGCEVVGFTHAYQSEHALAGVRGRDDFFRQRENTRAVRNEHQAEAGLVLRPFGPCDCGFVRHVVESSFGGRGLSLARMREGAGYFRDARGADESPPCTCHQVFNLSHPNG